MDLLKIALPDREQECKDWKQSERANRVWRKVPTNVRLGCVLGFANPSKVLAAFALFPKDISQPPREWAERFFNVQRWSEMPRGGHFAAMEEPELLAEDIRTWFRTFRDAEENSLDAGREFPASIAAL
jgi:hypothetical protein